MSGRIVMVAVLTGLGLCAGWLCWAIIVHGHWWSRLILAVMAIWFVVILIQSWRAARYIGENP